MRYEDMTELQRAKADMDFQRHRGGFGYKQAKKHYERLLRKGATDERDAAKPI